MLMYSRSGEFLELICTFNIDVGVCPPVRLQSNALSHFYGNGEQLVLILILIFSFHLVFSRPY